MPSTPFLDVTIRINGAVVYTSTVDARTVDVHHLVEEHSLVVAAAWEAGRPVLLELVDPDGALPPLRLSNRPELLGQPIPLSGRLAGFSDLSVRLGTEGP